MASVYVAKLMEVMENEFDTETLSTQAESLKDVLDAGGNNMFQQDQFDMFHSKIFAFITQSESRVADLESQKKEERDEDDELDEEDLLVFKEEMKNES